MSLPYLLALIAGIHGDGLRLNENVAVIIEKGTVCLRNGVDFVAEFNTVVTEFFHRGGTPARIESYLHQPLIFFG